MLIQTSDGSMWQQDILRPFLDGIQVQCCLLKPSHPYIIMHILHTVHPIFPNVLTRRICSKIKRNVQQSDGEVTIISWEFKG